MNLNNMRSAIKSAMDQRLEVESRAIRGTVKNGKLFVGTNVYEMTQAVDCDITDGRKVWALKAANNKAVVVGA